MFDPTSLRTELATACVTALALLAAGCGGVKHATTTAPPATHPQQAKAPSVCRPAAQAKIASFLGHAPAAVTTKQGTGNNGMPQCTFGAGKVALTANVDTAPQAYFRLERTVVEETQQFSTTREVAPAQHIGHLGLDADWFPGEQQLMTTDGKQFLTVTVRWAKAKTARRRALATAVARSYLAKSA
ncbi:MAG TPA: hypothetical protein VGF74_05200 [Thermoleophilaceae bacterium]